MSFELWEVGLFVAIFGGLAVHHFITGTYFKTNLLREVAFVPRNESPSEFAFCVAIYSLMAVIGLGLLVAKLVQQ